MKISTVSAILITERIFKENLFMDKKDVINEIEKRYEKSQSGLLLLSISCILMCLGLLGIAVAPQFTVWEIAVFVIGAAILFLTVYTDRVYAKKADALFVENFVIPEISKHLNGTKSESTPITASEIKKIGFFTNLQWSNVDSSRAFSGFLRDTEISFCNLDVYNLLNVSKGKHAKSDTEKDYVFRGRFFDVKADFDEEKVAEIKEKAERYDLCGEGSVRAEYLPGHMYILHNVAAGDIAVKNWLSFPFGKAGITAEETEERVRNDVEPYMTMLKYLF